MNLITTSSLLPAHANAGLALGKTYVGIDFGTSTTVVSIASYDAASNTIKTEALRLKQMLPDGTIHTAEIIPTVIAWMKEAERILVGKGASELMYEFTKGKNIWYWFKMELGVDLGAEYPQSEIADRAPFYIKNPKDCARVFFSYLKFLIAQYCEDNNLSDDIAYAVSVPASFEANQRKDLIDALTANDMKIAKQALIDEPNAAFISYVMGRAANGEPMSLSQGYNPKVLVFDFGAGTCDISILEIGVDVKGFYSKNISLSKFENCGGSDIDRYITYHYLMPRFLAENGKMMDDFITKDKKLIASRLFKIAENLKERVNKNLALLASDFNLPSVANSEVKTTIENHVSVFTNKGELKAKDFYLTNKEMAETMKVFLKTGYGKTTTINREEPYNSVFGPIDSAVKKARVSRDEIDYVLFVSSAILLPTHKDIKNFVDFALESEGVEEGRERVSDYRTLNRHFRDNGVKLQYVGNGYGTFSDSDHRAVIMTYHSAKGLDFDRVYIPFVNSSLFIPGSASKKKTLFMVAMTRPRGDLFITYTGSPNSYVNTFESTCSHIDIASNMSTATSIRTSGSSSRKTNPFGI